MESRKIHDAWEDLEKTQKWAQFEPPILNRLEMAACWSQDTKNRKSQDKKTYLTFSHVIFKLL
jgi:hypothetical protein